MNLRAKIFPIYFLFLTQVIIGQSDSLQSIENILDSIINDATIEQENSQLYDLIEQYIENPIDLNNSNESEIMKLPFMDIESANAIIKYKDKFGKIFSYTELELGNSISEHTIKILKAFTYLIKTHKEDSSSLFQNFKFKLRSRVSKNIQNAKGYATGYYKGSPFWIYNRLKLDANSKIKIGLVIEKDAGEKSYFDFYSYYFQIQDILKNTKILAGYYTVEFGQGLALWSPYSFSKSSDATNSIIKRARDISPYSSAGEFLFMKGGAINYSSNYFEFSSFYSVEDDDY